MRKNKLIFLILIFVTLISCTTKETDKDDTNTETEGSSTTKQSGILEDSDADIVNVNYDVFESTEADTQNKISQIFKIEAESLEDNLINLCKFSRHYLSDEKEDSIQYIQDKLIEYGYKPTIQEFPIYERSFNCNLADNIFEVNPMNSEVLGIGKNIIASHNSNKDGQKNLYLTAHYDTTSYTTGVIDNGTGSAIVLELAKILRDYDSGLNLIFILLDIEEKSQQGSIEFVRNLSESDKANALGCINIDMVGEIDAGDIIMRISNSEHNIISLLWNDIQDQNMKIGWGTATDEFPFYRAKIPAVTIINELPHHGLDEENTQTQLEYIDFGEMVNVTKQICRFIEDFNPEYYDDLLSNRVALKSNIRENNAYTITNASFEKINAKLIDNGFLCETQYQYMYTTGERFSINTASAYFYDNNNLHDYSIIENSNLEYKFYYKITAQDEETVKVKFYDGETYGTITSDYDISEKILEEIVKSFIESYYAKIFD